MTCPQCGKPLPEGLRRGLCPRCLLAGAMEPTAAPGGGDRPEPPPVAEVQAAFPQLEILEIIGAGGMGVVYKARQKSLNRLVALKLLAPHVENEPGFAERFSREAQALAALSHPNIVTIHDFGQAGGFFYLLMEFVEGITLRKALATERFSPEQALAIVPPICDALQFAHDHQIVHRDIKPENLLLDKDGRIKVADFGIARILGQTEPEGGGGTAGDPGLTAGATLGTPKYMAPEQAEHPAQVDHRADIYSLGVVLYEMLTGESPAGRFQTPASRVQIDVRLDEIVLRALNREPELRFQSAAEFRTMVETVVQSPRGSEPDSGPSKRGNPWFWSPLQSSATREIRANLTPAESKTAAMHSLLFGLWNAGTFFGPVFASMSLPYPLKWIFAFLIFAVGISFYPFFRKLQRQFLLQTEWAREHDIQPEQLDPMIAGSKRRMLIGFGFLGLTVLLLAIAVVFPKNPFARHDTAVIALSEQRLNGDHFEFKYRIDQPVTGWDVWLHTESMSGPAAESIVSATNSQILSGADWSEASVRLDQLSSDDEARNSGFSSIGPDRSESIRPLHGVAVFHSETSVGDRILSVLELRPSPLHPAEPNQQLLVRESHADTANGRIEFALDEILSTEGYDLVLETSGAGPTWKSQANLGGDGFVPLEPFGELNGQIQRFRLTGGGALRFTFPGVNSKAMEIARGLASSSNIVVTRSQPVVLFDMTNIATSQRHLAVLRLAPKGETNLPDLVFPLEPATLTYQAKVKPVAIIGWFVIAAGALYILLSIPLIPGTMPMNAFYGVRIAAAFESDERWRAINAEGGKRIAIGGLWVIAVGIVGLFVPNHRTDAYAMWACAVAVLAALIPAFQTWRWAQRPVGAKPSRAERTIGSITLAVLIALFLKAFVIEAYAVKGDNTAPEFPDGSHVLAWRLGNAIRPGDIIVYRDETGEIKTGRVMNSDPHKVTIRRNETEPVSIERKSVAGKIVTMLWLGGS